MDYTSITTCQERSRTHNRHIASGQEWYTDIPLALGGYGENPTPPEMLAATVASCMVSFMSFICCRNDLNAEGISVEACAIEADGCIREMHMRLKLPQHLLGIKDKIELAVEHCPVHKAIESEIAIRFDWQWLS